MRSQILKERFARLHSQRQFLYRAEGNLSPELLWERPDADKWSIGETLEHLTKMMRLFRRVSAVAMTLQRPFARARRGKSYPTDAHDIFAGRSMRAPRLIRPGKPPGRPPFSESTGALEKETQSLLDALAERDEAGLGHTWFWIRRWDSRIFFR